MPDEVTSSRRQRRRRWSLAFAYALLIASCESPFAPGVVLVGRIEINPAVLQLVVGGTTSLIARVFDADDALLPGAKVHWSSQNLGVVTVNQAGVATAVSPGTAQIAASSGGQSQTIAVTVDERPISLIRMVPAAASVTAGETVTLRAEPLDGTGALLPGRVLIWSTDAPLIATVDTTGIVTGVSVGMATISASSEGKVGNAVVTVLPPPVASIDVTPDGGTITAGSTLLLTATPRDAAGNALIERPLTWQSSNDGIATVSSSGLVTAIAAGTVTVTVSAPGGGPQGSTPSKAVTVTVLITPVASATIVPGDATVRVGQGVTLTVNLFDGMGEPLSPTGRSITWASGNPAVASVNASGVVSGLAVGLTIITVTVTSPGQAGVVQTTAQINVSNQPVVTVVVSPAPATVHVGALYAGAFTATTLDGSGQPLSGRAIVWTSSNQSIASVDATTGVVTGVSPGAVQIRATSEGVQGSSSVTVDLVGVASLDVAPPTVTLTPPDQTQLTAVPRDSAGNVIAGTTLGGRAALWSSADPAIATVNGSGLVTAVASGATSVSATLGGATDQSAITVMAVPIASIIVAPSPQTLLAGETQQLTATALDSDGNPLIGRVLAWSSADLAVATVNQSGLVTGVSAGGPIIVSASAEGKSGSAQITVLHRPAVKLAMSQQPPAIAQSGDLLLPQPAVRLLNDVNGPAPEAGIVVTAVLASGGGTLSGTLTATTDGGGIATFTDLAITGPAGPRTLGFSAPGLTGVVSSAVVLGAGGATQVTITTQPPPAATNGMPLSPQPVVRLEDGAGNPVALGGVDVTASISSGTGTLVGTVTATTDGTGTATYTDLAILGIAPGPFTLDFTATGLTAATSQAITLSAGTGSELAIATAPPAGATNAVPLGPQPVVRVTDSDGNPVALAGVTVSAALMGAGATLGGTVDVVTDGTGVATFSDLVITGTVGTYSIQFTAAGLISVTSGPIDIVAGAAAGLAITQQPSATPQNDAIFTQQPVIRLQDVSGNAVSQSGVGVAVAIKTGTGTLSSTSTLTATTSALGVASFAGLKITGLIGIRTLEFTSAPLAPVISANVDLQPGLATQMALTTPPSAAANSGEALLPQPVVQLRDVSNNSVPLAGENVSASVSPAGVTLTGATATSDPTGAATFSALTMTGPAGTYTLTFNSGLLSAVASGPIVLSAGTGAKLAITRQPSPSAQNGSAFAVQPQVRLRDASDNNVNLAGVKIFAVIASGGGTLGGTTEEVTAGSGQATFNDLSITGTVGKRTLLFSASGYLSIESDTVTLAAGSPTQLSIQTSPAGATSGAAFTTQPAIQLLDSGGNPVGPAGVNITVTFESGMPGATFVGAPASTTAATNSSGLATFAGLGINGLIGNYRLRFSASGLGFVLTGTFSVTVGTAEQLTITAQPPPNA
ncbi:MAG TPA: Ig-like domain-containing protein, partial [Gemmatimonadaceae bacterium]